MKTEGITMFLIHPGILSHITIKMWESANAFDLGYVGSTALGAGIRPWVEKYAPQVRSVPEVEAVSGCISVLKDATIENSGSFFSYEGRPLPW
jgi:hypothetical protein